MSPSREDLQRALDWRKARISEQQGACVEVAKVVVKD